MVALPRTNKSAAVARCQDREFVKQGGSKPRAATLGGATRLTANRDSAGRLSARAVLRSSSQRGADPWPIAWGIQPMVKSVKFFCHSLTG